MGAKINLVGQKYNKLTVIKETSKRDSSGGVVWECQCDCGAITYASSNALRSNHKQSCGCMNREQAQQLGCNNYIDITGQRFGRLTVIQKSNVRKNGRVYWECVCDCGAQVVVMGRGLRAGTIQSCGCLKSVGEEKISQLLTECGIPFVREKIFDDFKPYRYDFYVDNCYIIEYDGKQHFQDYSWGDEQHTLSESQERDYLKNSYCHSNKIPIIRIPYTHLNEIVIEDLLLNTTQFLIKGEK